jgi:hypothetical protein
MAAFVFNRYRQRITFLNGWTIELAIGAGTLSDNGQTTAQVRAFNAVAGTWYDFETAAVFNTKQLTFVNVTPEVFAGYCLVVRDLT